MPEAPPTPSNPDSPAPSFSEVLSELPPGKQYDNVEVGSKTGSGYVVMAQPLTLLYCDQELCQRTMLAESSDEQSSLPASGEWEQEYLNYRCRNCGTHLKEFAIIVKRTNGLRGSMVKVGEWPPFAPTIPTKTLTLLGGDAGMFLQGRRAEAQRMGIGAFSYYRRVVERRKNQLIQEIIKVATKVGAPPEVMASLEQAAREIQFKKALETVKVPESLLVDGHNPLTLLHSAISEGMHAESDEECLESAQAIRHVLVELVRRIDLALKSDAELKGSISKLLEKQSKKSAPTKPTV